MIAFFRHFQKMLKTVPELCGCFLLISGIGLYKAIDIGMEMNFFMLWLLGVSLGWYILWNIEKKPQPKALDEAGAWFLLAGAFVFYFFGMPHSWSLLFSAASFFMISGSILISLKLLCPVFILLVLTPEQAFFNVFFSYPLRVMSAGLSAFLLKAGGIHTVWKDTEIFMDGTAISITAACSGIEQLEVMLLLGFFLVLAMQKTFSAQVLHYLLILPALLSANVLRLTTTLLLYRVIGDHVFDPYLHTFLGWIMVLVSFLLLFAGGLIFEAPAAPPSAKKEKRA
ncbi:MAG: Transmembrane exosortase (Exosortase_EpsH) [Lentisphaerae bacterium ADurb.Bin242]|nr:MAG: Transmembrane exosortase (Exosortase_EpsH) [Lentisphaerae bacterium ADurb.Bin242]